MFSKWDKKADIGILLGYSDVGYEVLVNKRIKVARHVEKAEKNENVLILIKTIMIMKVRLVKTRI